MKIILTGATGYVGEGVLLDCLSNPKVEKVLSLSRRSTGIQHEKLEEWLLDDLMQAANDRQRMEGYDALFFCAGITSVGTPDDLYMRITHDIPLALAEAIPHRSDFTFIYISGAGTDINGRQKWQRIKGAVEQRLFSMGFKAAFAYRPAHMTPVPGQRAKQVRIQRLFSFMLPVGRLFGYSNTLGEVARSMVNVAERGYSSPILTPRDIRKAAHE